IIQRISLKVPAEQPRALSSLCSYLGDGKESVSGLGTTKKCFARYLPELESEGATWSQGYSACQMNATNERGSLLSDATVAQENIRLAAMGISTFIDHCLSLTEALDFFKCFSKMVRSFFYIYIYNSYICNIIQQSKEQLTTVYSISYNASEQALILNQQLNYIEVEHYLCTNRTEDNYVQGTDRIFQSLDKCLQQNETN
ncbi:hypothetical protein KR009_000388, partial [Drosophila setifemur]